jgi:hypothetical protein
VPNLVTLVGIKVQQKQEQKESIFDVFVSVLFIEPFWGSVSLPTCAVFLIDSVIF